MPYFIYKVTLPKTLEYIDTKAKYQEARQIVRDYRQQLQLQPEENRTVRMIFAKNQPEAEKLLLAPREERVIGED